MRINVLGPLEVALPGGSPGIKGSKRCALLAALLLQPGRTVSKSRLIDAIWDESPPSSATANIRTYVTDLRRSLGRMGDGRPRLTSSASGYLIEVCPEELDLLCFERLADEGAAAVKSGDVARAATCLDRAARLWRGRPFDGIELGSWARARVTALEDRRFDVLSMWVEARLALGRHDGLIVRLREMLAERPLSERNWAQLMIALDRVGRRSDALTAFAQARSVLARELGVEPGPELRRAHQRIRASAVPVVARRPCALPAVVPEFVGRSRTLDRLVRGACGLIGLSGPPGVGKTALAVRAAHALRPAFPDGQLYNALGGSTAHPRPPADVLAEFLRALAAEIPARLEERAALFRSVIADRRVLVVLDDAANAAQVRPLLPGTGACRVIITSRTRLTALEGVHRIGVGPLAEDDGVRLLGAIAGSGRVSRELVAALRIARACGCHPLALRIAAARLAMRPRWPLAALADRLWDERGRLDELTIGDLSVRAGLDSSYRMLASDARRAVRLLGVLDQVPARGMGDVLGRSESESDRIVEQLLHANLLVPVPGSEPAYRLDGLFRLYAKERALEAHRW